MPSTTDHDVAVAAHREAELQALGHAVLTVAARPRASASRRPGVAKCDAVHRVDRRVRGRRGRRRAALLDDRRAALLHRLEELALRATRRRRSPRAPGLPSMRACAKSGNCVAEWLPQIATLVTVAVVHAGLLRELRLGAVLVEAGHREPAVGGHVGRVRPRDEAVGVARVADHEHAHVARRVVVDRLALRLEDPAVDR